MSPVSKPRAPISQLGGGISTPTVQPETAFPTVTSARPPASTTFDTELPADKTRLDGSMSAGSTSSVTPNSVGGAAKLTQHIGHGLNLVSLRTEFVELLNSRGQPGYGARCAALSFHTIALL